MFENIAAYAQFDDIGSSKVGREGKSMIFHPTFKSGTAFTARAVYVARPQRLESGSQPGPYLQNFVK